MKSPLCSAFFLFSFSLALAQTAWTPAVMIKFNRLGGTDISPDGRLIAYTISSPVMEGEKSEFLTHIWVASADGKMNAQFTQGDKSCLNPRFSPDGNYLGFVSSRGNEAKTQLWVIRLAGGEAEQMTKSKSGVEQFAWSPDSKRIALIQRENDSEQEEKNKKEKRDWTIVDSWKYSHLYTIPVEKNAKGERPVKRLTKGDFHITNFDWSPDGKTIAFTHQISPSPDHWTTSDISSVPSDSGALKSLVAMKGLDTGPLFSPDGQTIAFVSDGGIPKWAGTNDVYLISTSGGQPKKLAESPDRQVTLFHWSADGKDIYFGETDHTTYRAFALPANGGNARILTPGTGNFTSFSISADDKTLAFIYQTPEASPEVFITALSRFEMKKLSNANPDFPKIPMGKTEVIHWKSKDGKDIEGLLTYPANYKSGRKYPLILNIHGGPAGVFTQNFTGAGSVYPIQAFAQQGYAVLRPNPRGSAGYGRAFRHANYNDWGFGDYDDDQTGVEHSLRRRYTCDKDCTHDGARSAQPYPSPKIDGGKETHLP